MLALRRLTKSSPNAAPILSSFTRHFSGENPNSAPSSAEYDDLINAAGAKRDFAAVRSLLTKRVTGDWFNTSNAFKFIAADVSVLDDLLHSLADISDPFTRKHAHNAVVSQLARLHRMPEAMRVAETMVRKDYGATVHTFRPILTVISRKNDMAAVWRVVEVMRVCDVQPISIAFNYVLKARCAIGDLTSAADVLVKMEEEGVEADERTYDLLVRGACKARNVEGALRLMWRMVEDGVAALHSTHAHVIKKMLRCGYVKQAVGYVKMFAGRDSKLDERNFGLLGIVLKEMERRTWARSVVKDMVWRGLVIPQELKDLSPNKIRVNKSVHTN
ncbi:hypothetical protein BUALT_Bualt06G0061500 [Buddleja alternifolia]|uniref:Pentatricopeptide repeat-containing protein n=1 Tax=Buddleja alternifolia TaxID=168488 RepID=A0AAV6XL12_9LAMI|nr:hypothetical protein BUALT_Bualt06G0061300 [Buddleja alternifolia]KAG8380871.1 hypothetical protein BUALT_Bualt06G0061500 [Buddleja alternifolia]